MLTLLDHPSEHETPMAKKSKTKKKKSFILSDEELDKVSGGSGPTTPAVTKISRIGIAKAVSIPGGINMEPAHPSPRPTPIRPNRDGLPGSGGQQM
jgi:hypothetical protein